MNSNFPSNHHQGSFYPIFYVSINICISFTGKLKMWFFLCVHVFLFSSLYLKCKCIQLLNKAVDIILGMSNRCSDNFKKLRNKRLYLACYQQEYCVIQIISYNYLVSTLHPCFLVGCLETRCIRRWLELKLLSLDLCWPTG